jgi:hypothetical protein
VDGAVYEQGLRTLTYDAIGCIDVCQFTWTIDGAFFATTQDSSGLATTAFDTAGVDTAAVFTAHSQVDYSFAPGAHTIEIAVVDAASQATGDVYAITVVVDTAAVPTPPNTDTASLGGASGESSGPGLALALVSLAIVIALALISPTARRRR